MSQHLDFDRVIFVLIDGARPDVLKALMRDGQLPNVSALFQDRVEPAVTVFPSTTGPAYLPFLTGASPGSCNLPGIRWFDKSAYRDEAWSKDGLRSYVGWENFFLNGDFQAPTLFEKIPESHAVSSVISRGAKSLPLQGFLGAALPFYAKLSHHWAPVDKAATRFASAALRKDPKYLFLAYLGVDEASHLHHPEHRKTVDAYRLVDAGLGKLKDQLNRQGQLKRTLFLCSSDHGLTQTHTHFEVRDVMEHQGLRPLYYPYMFRRACKSALMISGNAMAHIYFKGTKAWNDPVDPQLPLRLAEQLLDNEAIDHVIMRNFKNPASAEVWSTKGKGQLEALDRDRISYAWEGEDPLAMNTEAGTRTSHAWLEASMDQQYPDALHQILDVLRSPRSGDMILSAKNGFDLRRRFEIPEHHGSHGSLNREHMLVPAMASDDVLPGGPLRTHVFYDVTCRALGLSEEKVKTAAVG